LKLSIFDVADVNNPKEIAKFNIGDRGTSSEALYEPKAFLFDSAKGLLVLPVDLYLINQTATSKNSAASTDNCQLHINDSTWRNWHRL
jgi:inhibitor of cysteine peptidase